MRPSDYHAGPDGESPLDHVVVGAGLSGLAYAWRRHREGRRVLVLEQARAVAPTPPALVEGPAPYLERLLGAVPGAERLATPACGPLQVWTPGGLRSAAPSTLQRLFREPASLGSAVRARLAGTRLPQPVTTRVLRGGVGSLRAALFEALGRSQRVHFDRTAHRVLPQRGANERASARVETEAGTIRAREIALDVPAHEQARLLAPDAPHHAEVLHAVRIVEMTGASLDVAPAVLPPIAGCVRGMSVRARMRSALFLSHLAPARYETAHVEVWFETTEIEGVGEDALGRVALTELGRALGLPVPGHLVRTRSHACLRVEPGHRRRMAELAADLGGRGVKLLGAAALGDDLDRLAAAGVPVSGPLPGGVTVA